MSGLTIACSRITWPGAGGAAAATIADSQIKTFLSNCKFNGRMHPGFRGISNARAGAGTYIAVSCSQFHNSLDGDIFGADFDLWIYATNAPDGFFRNGVTGTMRENEQAISEKPLDSRRTDSIMTFEIE